MEGLIAGSHNISDRLLSREMLADGRWLEAQKAMVAMVPALSLGRWS